MADAPASRSVLVGMSGGVDSSVAACLLQEQGFAVTGATMRLFDKEAIGENMESTCCSLSDVEDARRVAHQLGIPYYVFNFSDDFDRHVMARFADCYARGLTPNPCIDCNRYLKFERMLRRAGELGIGYVATGHYARISHDGQRFLLQKARDADKDQTYFLYHLDQAALARYQLPLGELTKPEVREIAAAHGFGNARKRDSQDICFVPDGDYGAFLDRYTGTTCPPGDYIGADGTVLGRHRGHIHYTVGQRKGLNIALGRRIYVTGKDVEKNQVFLGENADLYASALEAGDLNLIACDAIPAPIRCTAKIRHSRSEAGCTVEQTGEDTLLVRFDEPQRAITPGQAVVLYDGETVLGGGEIRRAL
ncbi:MAG: tRNA 2-thiouridine(34) synthase MnmA [Oscillospiraceae bacterium]|nr:tRNA 2-thiouridine(34) synthase MnmA [Oscillospiraceae bacterium]